MGGRGCGVAGCGGLHTRAPFVQCGCAGRVGAGRRDTCEVTSGTTLCAGPGRARAAEDCAGLSCREELREGWGLFLRLRESRSYGAVPGAVVIPNYIASGNEQHGIADWSGIWWGLGHTGHSSSSRAPSGRLVGTAAARSCCRVERCQQRAKVVCVELCLQRGSTAVQYCRFAKLEASLPPLAQTTQRPPLLLSSLAWRRVCAHHLARRCSSLPRQTALSWRVRATACAHVPRVILFSSREPMTCLSRRQKMSWTCWTWRTRCPKHHVSAARSE